MEQKLTLKEWHDISDVLSMVIHSNRQHTATFRDGLLKINLKILKHLKTVELTYICPYCHRENILTIQKAKSQGYHQCNYCDKLYKINIKKEEKGEAAERGAATK